jgi:hypothetical protein
VETIATMSLTVDPLQRLPLAVIALELDRRMRAPGDRVDSAGRAYLAGLFCANTITPPNRGAPRARCRKWSRPNVCAE